MSAPTFRCITPGCKNAWHMARGLCAKCYGAAYRAEQLPCFGDGRAPCLVNGCPKHARVKGYCMTHYGRVYRHGDVERHKPGQPRTADARLSSTGNTELESAERDAAHAREVLGLACGLEARLHWRARMLVAEAKVAELQGPSKREVA